MKKRRARGLAGTQAEHEREATRLLDRVEEKLTQAPRFGATRCFASLSAVVDAGAAEAEARWVGGALSSRARKVRDRAVTAALNHCACKR